MKVGYHCEECETVFDSVDELEVMVVIGGEWDILCCPECQDRIEIIVDKENKK